jgi:hypothetical protein
MSLDTYSASTFGRLLITLEPRRLKTKEYIEIDENKSIEILCGQEKIF